MTVRALRRGSIAASRGAAAGFTLTGVTMLTEAGSTTDTTTYTTASVTPTANRLVLVWVMASGGETVLPSSVTGNGITYTLVAANSGAFSSANNISLWVGSSASPSAGTIDITFGSGKTGCIWRVEEWAGSSTPAIRQFKTGSDSAGAATSASITLLAQVAAGVAVNAGFRKTTSVYTADPDFTVGMSNLGYSTPVNRGLTEYDLTPTDAVASCSWTGGAGWNGIAVEIGEPIVLGSALSLFLDGVPSSYVSTPDTVAASVTSDIDLRAKVNLADWTPALINGVIAKYGASGQRSYRMFIDTAGKVCLDITQAGITAISAVSSVATGYTDGTTHWIRATWVNSTNVVQFFTSDDGSSWTQLGTDQSISATGIFDSTDPVVLGTTATAASASMLDGFLYYAEIRSGVGGTVVLSFDATTVTKTALRTPTTLAAGGTAGGTWTVNGPGWDWVT